MVKPKNSFRFYVIVSFFLASIVFLSGISIGFLINDFKQQDLNEDLASIKDSVEKNEVEIALMDYLNDNISCDYLNLRLNSINERVYDLGLKVGTYENSNGILNEDYSTLKKSYINSLINNWINVQTAKKLCNLNYSTILYFYTFKEDCNLCEEQAMVLSTIKNLYGSHVMIYSIDSTLGLDSVNILRYSYNITQYPSLVINSKTYSGYVSFLELKEMFE
ncbi:MAG: conjugal transfer protein TraF [Candidatus Nanoarchaeia archaeon]|nr:conjugal transfer protein TraF [Candidatus Nanoarchaeia archaeon]